MAVGCMLESSFATVEELDRMSDRMDKKTILKGMWWIKGREDNKFPGILTYGDGNGPRLEIFPKEYDIDKQLVPNNSTIYGDAFGNFKKLLSVTLLRCTSLNSFAYVDVGANRYKHEFVNAECVAIGLLLDDYEIEQVKSPQHILLTCPGLDAYSSAFAIDHFWKNNIPTGRPFDFNYLDRIVYTQPEPTVIGIDIGTISISLGPSTTARDMSSRYAICISLENPTSEDEVNSLIYSQLLSFLSIITGRSEYVETHKIAIDSTQAKSDSRRIELNYGHIAHWTQETEYSMQQTLLRGSEDNIRKFAALFPKWRENFAFVEELAYCYLRMVDRPIETNLLQVFPLIENYVLERVLKKPKKGMPGILSEVIHCIADHFSYSKFYSRHFPTTQREQIAGQLANFRNEKIHPKRKRECVFSSEKVYAYINVLLRSIFLIEMEYSHNDIDGAIGHWSLWRQIDRD